MKMINAEISELAKRGWKNETVRGLEELIGGLDPRFASKLEETARKFAENREISLSEALGETKVLSDTFGVNSYSGDLLLILYSLPFLHERSREKGIGDGVFYDSMDDIRCKVEECVECFGVVGTFVAGWYDGFFDMTRFAYGRFQYEPVTYRGEGIKLPCGKELKDGQTFINFHIPSNGIPLTDDVRLDSYRRAYPHYADMFDDGTVMFGCGSWLLYPEHRQFLPKDSNILRFMDDFDVIKGRDNAEFYDAWRVFGRFANANASDLPRDTSLRRAYAERLSAGMPTGAGFGVFAFDGERII